MVKLLFTTLLSIISITAYSHGISATDQAKILNASYIDFIQLGATHMLSGYDHLLFLFGVMFFLTRFSDIVKLITVFTIGHSITLIFATLLEIQANYYLIDAVIALTVCYKAFDNLDGFKRYFNISSPNITGMIFVFGLIHGFGLSTRLQQLPLGHHDLVFNILAFNIGVETGQIIALSIMFVVLLGWRKTASFQTFSKASNIVLIIAGGILLILQLTSYYHTRTTNEHQHTQIIQPQNTATTAKEKIITEPEHHHTNEENHTPKPAVKNHSHDGEHFHTH